MGGEDRDWRESREFFLCPRKKKENSACMGRRENDVALSQIAGYATGSMHLRSNDEFSSACADVIKLA